MSGNIGASSKLGTGQHKVQEGLELRIMQVMAFMKAQGFKSIREILRHFFTNQSTKQLRDGQDNFYSKGVFENILGIVTGDH